MKVIVDRIVVGGLAAPPEPGEFKALVSSAIAEALGTDPPPRATEVPAALAAAVTRTAGGER